jgi:2-methylcitrate dehydratase
MTHTKGLVRDQLADLILSIDYEGLPAEVVKETKRLILDTLACAWGGFAGEPSKIVRKTVQQLGGNPESTVIGEGTRTSCALATLANGTMIRYLDNNDYYHGRDPSHPSGNLAAALAVAEREKLGGHDVISAMVVAYEVQVRLCDCAGTPNIWERGWHHATNMQFASAALASVLLRLDRQATANALSIAGSHNNTLAQSQRGNIPMMKASAEATIAKGGVEAALLAKNGLTGPEEVFEGELGWARAVAGEVDFETLTKPMKGHYRIMDACMKPYAAEMMTQAPIQAAIDVVRENGLDVSQIERVEARFHEYALNKPSWDPKKLDPRDRETADHSFPYCIAVAMLEGDCGPDQFTADKLFSPVVRDLMGRIELVPDPELTALWPGSSGAAIVVITRSGQRFEKLYRYPPGHPKNRLSDQQVESKFRHLSRGLLTEHQADRVIEAVWHLDECNNLADFMAELTIEDRDEG